MRTKLRNDGTHLKTLKDRTLPRPLQRSAPRAVGLNGAGWVVAALALALSAGCLGGGALLAKKHREDSVRSAELHATVVPSDALVTQVRRTRGKKARVTIHYRFAADGRNFENRVRLRQNDPLQRTVKSGGQVRVLYMPSAPGRNWLAGYGPRAQPIWFAAIPPMVGVPIALALVRLLLRHKRLLEEGRAAVAKVICSEKSKDDGTWRVTYSWRLLSGAARQGHLVRSAELEKSGSFVPLVYDPDKPESHSVYPVSLVKLL